MTKVRSLFITIGGIIIFLSASSFCFANQTSTPSYYIYPGENTAYLKTYLNLFEEKLLWLINLKQKTNSDISIPVELHIQQRPLSCECASTSVIAKFQGYSYFTENLCIQGIEIYEGPLLNGIWGNPNKIIIKGKDNTLATLRYRLI